jgi:hypothetical protein
MADDFDFSTDTKPTLQQLATFLADELFDVNRLKRVEVAMRNAHAEGATVAQATQLEAIQELSKDAGEVLGKVEEAARGATAFVLAKLVAHMLGVEVPPEALRGAFKGGEDSVVGKALGELVISGIRGDGQQLEPGTAGATRLVGMLSNLAITSWFEGIVAEWAVSWGGIWNPVDKISELGHDIVEALGLDNLARIALRPLVQTTIATPLEWQTNKIYRPNLLSESLAIQQFLRGKWSPEQTREELARLGWSDDRQDALLASHNKYLSLDDTLVLVRESDYGRDFAIQNLRDQGYDETAAKLAVTVAETRRLVAIHDDSLAALRTAHKNREITSGEFAQFLEAIISDPAERAAHEVAAGTMRDLNVQHMSQSQVVACVKADILPRAFYRDWLQREGFPEDEAFALELLLAHEIDAEHKVEDLRAQLLAERNAEKLARAKAAAARAAEVEAQRALARRGSLSDLNRAVVRGLIPIARLTEVLTAQYDPDTVDILVGLVEDDRQKYLDQIARAEEAKKRAAQRHIDVGALESAVLENVVSVADFRRQLSALGFNDADADVITATLQARKNDLDAAAAKRAQAEAAAKAKKIDLNTFEQLVRRGLRSRAQYEALLVSLGFDDAARAAIDDLLSLKIADDQKAAQARADAEAKLSARGLSFEQFRRAVILEVKTMDDFQRFLVEQGFTADAQIALVAELRAAVADAVAARTRREAADATPGARALPLSTVRQAARLSVISPDVYEARLVDAGYSDDDVSIDMELLLTEIADVQAARAKRDALERQVNARGLTLADVERAVKAGVATVEDYRAKALTLGYSLDDVTTIVGVLEQELVSLGAAKARHAQIEGELLTRGVSLAQIEKTVISGAATIDDYIAQLEALDYSTDDAELLGTLLVGQLATAPP